MEELRKKIDKMLVKYRYESGTIDLSKEDLEQEPLIKDIEALILEERKKTLEEVEEKYKSLMIEPNRFFLNYIKLELNKLDNKRNE